MRLPLNGSPRITTEYMVPGTGSLGKHLGLDWGVPTGTPVYAPGNGKVVAVSTGAAGGKMIELVIGNYAWRFLHLSWQDVKVGQTVTEGQRIGLSGATGLVSGPHLHSDVRTAGTIWNASVSNYRDPRNVVLEANKPIVNMPSLGSKIKLIPTQTRTTYRPGTATVAGHILVTDNSFVYTVRGHDAKYPGRIFINSASGGGQGVGLALYYLNGQLIPGWQKV